MGRRQLLRIGAGAAVALGAALAAGGGWRAWQLRRAADLVAAPVRPPTGALSVYHLGHSLVGRDMPAMLAQLAPAGHSYASQLGWGASLRDHYDPDIPVNGFAEENDHDRFAPARETLADGAFEAVVFTEMVELRDAIRYHDSAATLARWAQLARAARGDVRLYLYETWHHTDDPQGWAARIAADYQTLWLDRVLLPAVARSGEAMHVIPGGQCLASVAARMEDPAPLFARTPEGTVDTIHLGDLGNYLIALVHFAVLYQRSPVGLPPALNRADGTAADPPDAELALMMQQTVWDTVRALPQTGIAA
ncbi:hypothetical protein KDD17_09315 [Sulfitobacter albidus]|uniref:Uncharacterized protein n=1 Tax=Sulfitobacter albidus TaxID=2829501 RepID=A0A975PNM1_9RHOB|nr:hypothetical protein KDD17_09315 [Sulfitobacter albidus]